MDTCVRPKQPMELQFPKDGSHLSNLFVYNLLFFKKYLLSLMNVNPEQEIDLSLDLIAHDQKLIIELSQFKFARARNVF